MSVLVSVIKDLKMSIESLIIEDMEDFVLYVRENKMRDFIPK